MAEDAIDESSGLLGTVVSVLSGVTFLVVRVADSEERSNADGGIDWTLSEEWEAVIVETAAGMGKPTDVKPDERPLVTGEPVIGVSVGAVVGVVVVGIAIVGFVIVVVVFRPVPVQKLRY